VNLSASDDDDDDDYDDIAISDLKPTEIKKALPETSICIQPPADE
jgi:hypothetical protein